MKLKTNNFSGTINFDYKVEVDASVLSGENMVYVILKVKMGNDWESLSAAGGELSSDYTHALRTALLRAEEKFGIDLLSIDIDNLKSA